MTDRFRTGIAQPELTNSLAGPEACSPPTQTRIKLKKIWLNLHLYLGLFGGALFVLVSLTGSFLVFYKAIDVWLNPTQLTTNGSGPYKPLNEVLVTAQATAPPGGWLDSLELPTHERGVFHAWHRVPTDQLDQFRWYQVTIDPHTATVLSRDRKWGEYLVSFIYQLHASLVLDDLGETIVGFVAIFLLVSISTGLYLWWPRPGRLRRAFTVARSGSVIRRHYDWHKLSGFYSAIVLGMLAFTGVYLEFGDYVVPLVRVFSPVREFPKEEAVQSLPVSDTRPLPVEEAVSLARQVFPEGEVRYVGIPHGDTGVYQVGLRQPGEVRESGGESQVWLDQYSGQVLFVHDWRQFTSGETFVAWLFPLHNGEAFGLVGRWIVFFTGFVPLVLYVTALRMWWLKRRAHRRQNQKAMA